MPRFTVLLLATSITVLFGAVALAGTHVVYEWTDAHGEVHYTDQWKPGAKLIRIQTADQPAGDSSAMQGIQNESDAASRDVRHEEAAEAVQRDQAKIQAARCAQAKSQYKSLMDSRRIYTTDKSGQRQYLSNSAAEAAR
ncbi:MAG: DUF4124 domain-containing protein, partial [Proteobacteria bacterium]|nr:DUF4124 domain-containing protein [Pseudomonadota bacterium]